jgi:hypothetical protein
LSINQPTKLYEQFQPPERLTLLLEAMARNDDAEVERLQRSCPRSTYTGQDRQFEDRWTMAFDILAVVCIDLRCLWGKMHVLRWVLGEVREMATAQNINAAFAFLDGERCGKGKRQMGFFARPMPHPNERVDYSDDDEGEQEPDRRSDEELLNPTPLEFARGERMEAVQRRSEHFTTCSAVVLLSAMNDISKDLVNAWSAFDRFCRIRLGVSAETMLKAWQFPFDDFFQTLRRYEKVKPDPAKVKEYLGYIAKHWDSRFRPKHPGHEYVTYRGADADADEDGDGEQHGGGDGG